MTRMVCRALRNQSCQTIKSYMRAISVSILTLLLVVGTGFGQTNQKVSGDPDAAKLVTSDIHNFWRAFDQAKPENAVEVFEREYFKPGSIGLSDFTKLRLKDAKTLTARVMHFRPYYESARASTLRIESMQPKIRASFYALKYLYPEAVFPDVYFMIGMLGTGGTASGRALLIGAEMYGRTPTTPEETLNDWLKQVLAPVENVPIIVAHELIHFQQKSPLQQRFGTLLGQSINEGSADFIAELISGGNINTHLFTYGDPREKQLWEEFKAEMSGKNTGKWLYNGSSIKDRPADLGYYIGYKITESYYKQAADKRLAIKAILEIKDFQQFLKDSGYEKKFTN